MNDIWNLSQRNWTLAGLTPNTWRLKASMETGVDLEAEVGPIPATVPGSVQHALQQAGLLPDWNLGLNHRLCDWVENRHWLFECKLPVVPAHSGAKDRCTLELKGLDHAGHLLLNGKVIADFDSAFRPYRLDISEAMAGGQPARLGILFTQPPRSLGQIGRTSEITDQKPRYYFGWDWIPRLVQIGIFDSVTLYQWRGARLETVSAQTGFSVADSRGAVRVLADLEAAGDLTGFELAYELLDGSSSVASDKCPAALKTVAELIAGTLEPWWPNGLGPQKRYSLCVRLIAPDGSIRDERELTVGFRKIEWRPCDGAPAGATPWICVVNDVPLFLQGVNWTPLLPNFADAAAADYERLARDYRRMGCNTLRVWGGAARERDLFYDLCDQLGLLVWQEFPLSSSGVDNIPPRGEPALVGFPEAARWTVTSLRHHPCLLLWCGGNELTDAGGIPCSADREPLLAAFGKIAETEDPQRRFIPTSPSGPKFWADRKEYGNGCHWDTHGPWKLDPKGLSDWQEYWDGDDSLFRSEVGSPGASSTALIEKYSGGEPTYPCSNEVALWRRTNWWTEWKEACQELGREPGTLEEYVQWSRKRQARALEVAARSCKSRFPRCGGFLVWMGHDCFPCTANTAIIEFDGAWKPAATALQAVFLPAPATVAIS